MSTVDVLVVDHRDSYTWNLVHLIAAVTGAMPDVAQHDEVGPDDLRGRSHLVLSPGPGRPDDPKDFAAGGWLPDVPRIPVLGICLGLQGLVTVHGGQVEAVRPAHGEVATIRHDAKGIFRGLPDGFHAVRYHSLAVVRVPPDFEVSARSEDGTVMGVRHRTRLIDGLQFHPESVLSEYGPQLIANFLKQRG